MCVCVYVDNQQSPLDPHKMERELNGVLVTNSDSSENEAEDQADESEEKSLLNPTPQKPVNSTYFDGEKNLRCNWELVKTIVIVAFMWIAYFLCYAAISTISPFFPKEARHNLLSRSA